MLDRRWQEGAYFTSSSTEVMATSSDRSTFKIEGGFALERPVPVAFHPPLSNACTTLRPRRPVAPVISAAWLISVRAYSIKDSEMMSPQPAKRNAVLYVDDVTKLGFRRLFQHRRFVNKTRICTLINQIQIVIRVRTTTYKNIHT